MNSVTLLLVREHPGRVPPLPSVKRMARGVLHVPTDETRELVGRWAGLGQPQDAICRKLRIDDKTLRKHYRDELDVGVDEANVEVANSIMLAASGREVQNDGTIKRIPVNSTLAIWWSKTRMRWKEPPREEASNSDGGATIVIRGGIAAVHHEPSDESAT